MSDESSKSPIALRVLPTGSRAAWADQAGVDGQRKELDSTVQSAASATTEAAPASDRRHDIVRQVVETLQNVYDPEIPVSIYELGLIYGIDVDDDANVKVRMTLTAPACPVAGSLPGEVERKIETIPAVKSAEVELVWDPPWDRSRMSEAALLQLGLI